MGDDVEIDTASSRSCFQRVQWAGAASSVTTNSSVSTSWTCGTVPGSDGEGGVEGGGLGEQALPLGQPLIGHLELRQRLLDHDASITVMNENDGVRHAAGQFDACRPGADDAPLDQVRDHTVDVEEPGHGVTLRAATPW